MLFSVLVKKAQKEALEYKLQYGEEIPPTQLAHRISLIMQEFTQSGYVYFIMGLFGCKYFE